MNSDLFSQYQPAINAFISADGDKTAKSWDEVVSVFFELNADTLVSSKTALARAFDNVGHPNYPRIETKSIKQYIESFPFSASALEAEGFTNDVDFIEDGNGVRISFEVLRLCVFTKSDRNVMNAYQFIDNIFQMWIRYNAEMKAPTYWALVRRIKGFTVAQSPQNARPTKTKPTVPTEQPIVYVIVKGSLKSIKIREKKLITDHTKSGDETKFESAFATPIYQSTRMNLEDEIDAAMAYIHDERRLQILKITKAFILIDSTQTDYSIEELIQDIETAREYIRIGDKTYDQPRPEKPYAKRSNSVDINIFCRTDGKYIDAQQLVPLTQPIPDAQIENLIIKAGELEVEPGELEVEPIKEEVAPMEVEEEDEPDEKRPVKRAVRGRPATRSTTTGATKRTRS